MAGEIRTLSFTAITYDIEHWPAEELAVAEAAGEFPHDWAADELRRVMREAGEAFLAEHPGVFEFDELF